mmetsp:Transcript_15446/g.27066  ORF Transcript_15446/g.27066 Transcript_15446/m.27066 type:complete len:200 (-) Transcript_15446:1008-1607(-)
MPGFSSLLYGPVVDIRNPFPPRAPSGGGWPPALAGGPLAGGLAVSLVACGLLVLEEWLFPWSPAGGALFGVSPAGAVCATGSEREGCRDLARLWLCLPWPGKKVEHPPITSQQPLLPLSKAESKVFCPAGFGRAAPTVVVPTIREWPEFLRFPSPTTGSTSFTATDSRLAELFELVGVANDRADPVINPVFDGGMRPQS